MKVFMSSPLFSLDKIYFSKNASVAFTPFAVLIKEDETNRMESLS